jgi:hypothetical protein
VIVSDIEKVSCEVHQNEKVLGVPVRGYVATSRRVNRTEWDCGSRLGRECEVMRPAPFRPFCSLPGARDAVSPRGPD